MLNGLLRKFMNSVSCALFMHFITNYVFCDRFYMFCLNREGSGPRLHHVESPAAVAKASPSLVEISGRA